MLWLILLSILFAAAIFNYAARKHMRDAVTNIPGPYNTPIIGAVQAYINLDPKTFLKRSLEYRKKYGSIVKAWAFNRLVVSSSCMELNEQILTKTEHLVKQRSYRMLRQWLGVGLLLSDGHKWFARRKIITPTFHFKILEEFVEVFDQQSAVFIKRLATKLEAGGDGDRTAFDVYPFVCLAALDIIAETAMGTKVYAQTDAATEYATAVNQMTKLMAWRFMKVHLNSEILFTILYPHLKWQQIKLINTMHEFTKNVIRQRRYAVKRSLDKAKADKEKPTSPLQNADNNNMDDNNDNGIGTKKRMALLDVLLQSTIDGQPLSDEDIREEVDTFMFEGHDTTTSAICFALHLISRHPDVQQKLYAEVIEVFGEDTNRPIILRDLSEMKYTECVIKETLRLYPSVPIIGRQLQKNFKYTHSIIGDGLIPAGAEFLVFIYGMLRDPKNYESPDEFQPERHQNAKSESSGDRAFSLIPFSAGPRNCIGQKFAMLEMKMIIGKVIREYELLPLGEAVEPELNIVLRSSTGFQLGLKRRS